MRDLRLLFFLLFCSTVFGQVNTSAKEKGIPYIQNYGHKIYGSHEQNWSVAQDNKGLLYFGNSDGLLEYDGATWRHIQTAAPYIVRSLAVTPENQIFLGGYNYFGYLARDSTDNLSFQSLSDSLNEDQKSFGNVWNTYTSDSSVYFQTYEFLFRWDYKKIKAFPTTFPMNRSFSIRDTIYLVLKERGLVRMKNDAFELVAGGELFAAEKIFSMTSISRNEILIVTRNLGLFIYNSNKLFPFKTQIDAFLKEYKMTAATVLQDGTIAISTRDNGVVVIDREGRLLQQINKQQGLNDNTVWNIYGDKQGGLWLALNNGIARIELPAAITYFTASSGIEGTVESVVRHKGILYVATPLGLYFFDPAQPASPAKKVKSFVPYKLISTGNTLIASGYNGGTHILQKDKMVKISDHVGNRFLQSAIDARRVFIGTDNGLASLYLKNNSWVEEDYINLQSLPVRDIIEDKNGELWLGTSGSTIIRIKFDNGSYAFEKARVIFYKEQKGLLFAEQNHTFNLDGQVLIGNGDKIMEYDENRDEFRENDTFKNLFKDSPRMVSELEVDAQGNLWIFSSTAQGMQLGAALATEDNSYRWQTAPFRPLAGYSFYAVYPDPVYKNIVWFGGPDGLFRFDKSVIKNYDSDFTCLVRAVSTHGDSILYSGYPPTVTSAESRSLAYHDNALRFSFSAAFYQKESTNRFQYFLDGFDDSWSEWSPETKATYTNIPEGSYTFRVRAQNIFKTISKEASYTFKILPPWYRTWWAYGLWGVIMAGFILGLIKLRSLKLENEKKELQKIVEQRTDELQLKNVQLNEQAEKLKEIDHIKSRFFTNISHEFRTPLTLIKGPAEEMLNKSFHGDADKAFKLVLNNANRLLRLINQLLDLSKLESGAMELKAALQPLSSFVEVMVNLYSSLAESRQIHLEYIKPAQEIEIYFDHDKLEQILNNLLSNAFKFTPQNGIITVAINHMAAQKDWPQGAVEISVHDSGAGIPDNEIDIVFERFSQGQNSNGLFGSSGVGLALTKELVELHHGCITVSSIAHEGTEFDVILALGKEHLNENEIITESEVQSMLSADKDVQRSDISLGLQQQIEQEDNGATEKNLVLIVEDHPEVRDYIREHLQNEYQVIEAANGSAGLDLAREQLPDLIISDVMMPEMDGYQLTNSLKKDSLTSHIPVILLTAKAADEDKIAGLELGADAYMAKPFNARELEVRVKKLVETRAGLREKFRKEFLLEPADIKTVSPDDAFIHKVHDTIDENMSDPDFNVESLLKVFAIGQRQFTRKVLALTGQTPVQFIRIMRLKRAKKMIEQQAGTVSQIAYDVGFNNLSYFSKSFRQHFGKLPSEV